MNPKYDETKIGVVERVVFACVCWAISAYVVILAPYFSVAVQWETWLFVVRLGVWVAMVGATLRYFLLQVPEVTGLVVLDLLKVVRDPITRDRMAMKTFSPSLHIKFPWDVVREKNFVSLERVTQEFTESYPSQEGPMLEVKCSYQYLPDVRRLQQYIAVDEKTISSGFTDVNSSILGEEIYREHTAAEARMHAKDIERRVYTRIDGDPAVTAGRHATMKEKLEEEFGINFKIFTIKDMDFEKSYQEMRSAKARMDRFGDIAKGLKTKLTTAEEGGAVDTITNKDAANLVLVDQGKAQKNIFELEGSNLAGAIVGLLGKLLPKGGL